ncbi:MAG: DUF934 domain-containing protein [Rhodothalassiaceae bacterium]
MELIDLRRLGGAHLDPYPLLDDGTPPPGEGSARVSLARLEEEGAALFAAACRLGVEVPCDIAADRLVPWLDRLKLIAIHVAKFSDGRVFSLARRLREQFAYEGEIRAVGHLLADHAEFLLRSGVDSAAAPSAAVAESMRHRLQLYGLWYQDAVDARPTVVELRHGRTRRRLAS